MGGVGGALNKLVERSSNTATCNYARNAIVHTAAAHIIHPHAATRTPYAIITSGAYFLLILLSIDRKVYILLEYIPVIETLE